MLRVVNAPVAGSVYDEMEPVTGLYSATLEYVPSKTYSCGRVRGCSEGESTPRGLLPGGRPRKEATQALAPPARPLTSRKYRHCSGVDVMVT